MAVAGGTWLLWCILGIQRSAALAVGGAWMMAGRAVHAEPCHCHLHAGLCQLQLWRLLVDVSKNMHCLARKLALTAR